MRIKSSRVIGINLIDRVSAAIPRIGIKVAELRKLFPNEPAQRLDTVLTALVTGPDFTRCGDTVVPRLPHVPVNSDIDAEIPRRKPRSPGGWRQMNTVSVAIAAQRRMSLAGMRERDAAYQEALAAWRAVRRGRAA